MRVKRRNYDDACKRAAIRLVTVNGPGVSEPARNLGINAKLLGRWKREDAAKETSTSARTGLGSADQTALRQLRHAGKRLRMEREVLQKALGSFANESH